MSATLRPAMTSPEHLFRAKDYYSTLTHFIGYISSILATPALLVKAAAHGAPTTDLIWYSVFMISLILLYGASASYHGFNISPRANETLKRLDHAMIFILIAGTYTPVCLIGLGGKAGLILCLAVWAIGLIGLVVKMFWIYCPKWFSSVIYIAMGWACAFQLGNIYHTFTPLGFGLLLAGGIFYTVGGLLYPLKIRNLSGNDERPFGMHEIFHIFIMLGSLCHFLMMYLSLAV